MFNTFLSSTANETLVIDNDAIYSPAALRKNAFESFYKKNYKRSIFLFTKYLKKRNDIEARTKLVQALILEGYFSQAESEINIISRYTDDENNQMLINELKRNYRDALTKSISSRNSSKKGPSIHHVELLDNKFPSHYLCASGKKISRWEKDEIPIKVFIPLPSRELDVPSPDNFVRSIKEAMIKWTKAIPELKLSFISTEIYANIIIRWHPYLKNNNDFAFTTPPIYNGEKKVSIINLAVRTAHGRSQFSYEHVLYNEKELYRIAIHEAGHSFGLGDSDDSNDVMYYGIHGSFFELLEDKNISRRDIQTIQTLYSLRSDSVATCKGRIAFTLNQPENFKISDNKYKDMRKEKLDNYLCFSPGTPTLEKDGSTYFRNYMRWDKKEFPLKVYLPLPPAKLYKIDNPENYKKLVRKAFDKWSESIPEIARFVFTENESNANIIIEWSDYFAHQNYWGAALSFPDDKNQNHKIKCIVKLAVKAQPGWYSKEPIYFGDDTFYGISLHEIGHALGLDHGPDLNGATGNAKLISQRDINTLKILYSVPITEDFLCGL